MCVYVCYDGGVGFLEWRRCNIMPWVEKGIVSMKCPGWAKKQASYRDGNLIWRLSHIPANSLRAGRLEYVCR